MCTDAETTKLGWQSNIGICNILNFIQSDQLRRVPVEDHLQYVDEFIMDVDDALSQHPLHLLVVKALHSVRNAIYGLHKLAVGEFGNAVRVHKIL